MLSARHGVVRIALSVALLLLGSVTLTLAEDQPPREVEQRIRYADREVIRAAPALQDEPSAAAPPDARKVLEAFHAQEEAIQRETQAKLSDLRQQLIKQLQQLQDQYTKAAKLDEAVAIRDLIRSLGESVVKEDKELVGHDNARQVIDDPGTLERYRGQIGTDLYCRVTGAVDGRIWGTDIYSDDSPLATAAVHAGALSAGQTAIVRVTILPPQAQYVATTRNGVTSNEYGQWFGSYRIDKLEPTVRLERQTPATEAPRTYFPTNVPIPATSRGTHRVILLNLTGSTQGQVWGTDVYTDDSSPAAAAVHAGVLKDGETGIVKIIMGPGMDSYQGSTRNGVSSQEWGSWGGSFRIEKVTPVVGAEQPAPGPTPLLTR